MTASHPVFLYPSLQIKGKDIGRLLPFWRRGDVRRTEGMTFIFNLRIMLGLRSHIIQAENIIELAAWYEKVLEKKPYFEAEAYIGFDAGGFELGIFKRETGYIQMGNNVEVYWGVDDIESELERLVELGATKKDDLVDVGGGIVMASVIDPFGNFFGIIYNPTFTA